MTRASARLGPFGHEIRWYREVGSTNDIAASWAERGGAEGLVVVAEAQTEGRGRHGRTWVSPAGAGLYVSVVMRPPDTTAGLLTLAAGVAVADGVEIAAGLRARVKWPNDVYIGERKLAGVLAEAGASVPRIAGDPALQYVVVGIGINIMPAAYPPDVASRATSLEGELGRPVDRGLLLAECLCALAARYEELRRGHQADVLNAWRARAASTLGRPVTWTAGAETITGIADDIDDTGALLMRTATGRVRVISGEVVWT